MGKLLYGFFRIIFWFIFRVIFRTEIRGRYRVPRHGPLLVAANHISFVDPPLLGVTVPRQVEFMTMVELFRNPVLARLVRAVGCFPVDRAKVDHTAAREAVRRLRRGRCIAIFPEGGIRLTQKSVLGGDPELRPGAETIAALGGAAILPVVIRGSRKPYVWRNWLRRETMRVTFGQPFCLWKPKAHGAKPDFAAVVRAELLKTVELD
jgi:1-acyl-sn-glycerol-3-phosphate acyltransferase